MLNSVLSSFPSVRGTGWSEMGENLRQESKRLSSHTSFKIPPPLHTSDFARHLFHTATLSSRKKRTCPFIWDFLVSRSPEQEWYQRGWRTWKPRTSNCALGVSLCWFDSTCAAAPAPNPRKTNQSKSRAAWHLEPAGQTATLIMSGTAWTHRLMLFVCTLMLWYETQEPYTQNYTWGKIMTPGMFPNMRPYIPSQAPIFCIISR